MLKSGKNEKAETELKKGAKAMTEGLGEGKRIEGDKSKRRREEKR
jgi:hypothetical protein